MLSKNQIKLINRLHQKKYRNKDKLFIVEGYKSVLEFINSTFQLDCLYFTENLKTEFNNTSLKHQIVSENELKKISALKNPNQILGVFKIPNQSNISNNGLILVLDDIKDPGNLGTIIRLCDWFGIEQLVCSLETVDCFNPKVVQASMGSLTRIKIIYTQIINYLTKTKLPIYVSLLTGENIYKTKLPKDAIIIMGNEANGISENMISKSTNTIHIPHFGLNSQTESLNVATATAIILSEFKRN